MALILLQNISKYATVKPYANIRLDSKRLKMIFSLKNTLVSILIVLLTACQSSKKQDFQGSGFHITDVAVTMPEQEATNKLLRYTDGFGTMLDNTISHHAAEYNATRVGAVNPYILNVNVEKVHFKNAIVSLLVGDANHISGTASIVDRTTSQPVHAFPFTYVDGASAALNGISGAVLSVVVKKEAAEGTLSKGVARTIMKRIFTKSNLPDSAKTRLRQKTVYQPMTTAMSPLSNPLPASEEIVVNEEVVVSTN